MKKYFKLIGIIALVAVVGLSMACGGGDDTPVIFPVIPPDDGGNGGNTGGTVGGGLAQGGTITLTDIPSEYNGKYAFIQCRVGDGSGQTPKVMGSEKASSSGVDLSAKPLISNGTVTIPLWIIENGAYVGYTGNDTFYCWFQIYSGRSNNLADPINQSHFYVTFTNGSATTSLIGKPWAN